MKKRVLSIILVLIMFVSLVPIAPMLTSSAGGKTLGTNGHVADDDSSDTYPTLMDLRENSRRAGRVWADKSVFEQSITLDWDTDGIGRTKDYDKNNVKSENGVTIINNSDFLHMFSALGSGVASQNIQALDVVFILDTSASMSSQGERQFVEGKDSDYITEDDRKDQGFPHADINMNPRLEHAVDSINNSIDQIMEASAYNRVALVTFNLGAATVLPLDRYRPTKVVRTEKDNNGNIKYYSGGLHDGEERYLTVAQVSNKTERRTGTTRDGVEKNQTAVVPTNPKYDSSNYLLAGETDYDDRFEQKDNSNVETDSTKYRFMDSQGTVNDWKAVEINAVSQTKTAALSTYIGVKSTTDNSTTQHVFWGKNNIPYLHTSAGTDTYWGIHEGMQVLRDPSNNPNLILYKDKAGNLYNTRDEMPSDLRDAADPVEVQRQPIIVLITDGAPNPESSGSFGYSKNLWTYQYTAKPSTSNTSSNLNTIKSEIARRDSANGFLVAASASYEKRLVEAKYNDTEVRMYNFGICMDYAGDGGGTSDTAHDGQVALAALNPASLFDPAYRAYSDKDDTVGYETYNTKYFETIRGWWETYHGKQPVPLTSEKTSYTYTLNHPADDIDELEYATGFFPIYEPKSIKDELGRLLSEWLYPAHRAVIGDNDVGVNDTLSYVDPIGQYMEVKDVRYVLLFGTLYNVTEDGGLKYFDEVDPPIEDDQGNIITEREVKNPDLENQNYDYTKQFYKITSIADRDGNGNPINNALTSMPTGAIANPGYVDSTSNPDHQFSLDDIMIYVKDTGDYRDDTVQNVHADTGSTNQNLYIDIPTAALPMQVATITLNDEDKFVGYSTNIGLTDRDIDSSGNLTEEYYLKKQQSTPIRVIYEVGIDKDILNETTGKVDMTKVDAEYLSSIEDGGYRDGGKVYFYSNWYNREGKDYDGYVAAGDEDYSFGDAFVSFTANYQNRYYVFEDNRLMFIRTDENDTEDGTAVKQIRGEYYTYTLEYNSDGTRKSVSDDDIIKYGNKLTMIDSANAFHNGKGEDEVDGQYYILIEYYDREGLVQYVLPRKGSEFGFGTEADGSQRTENDYLCWYNPEEGTVLDYTKDPLTGYYLAAKKGSLRVGDLSAGIGPKLENKTGTADSYYIPTISNSTKTVQSDEGDDVVQSVINLYLGNNGRLEVNNNLLLITKQTTNIDGENRSDADKEVFTYTVRITDPEWGAGPHSVIMAVYEDKYHYDVWRALVDKLELLTGNYGFLWGNDGTRSIVDEKGQKYTEESTGPQYYVYVGGESGANPTGSRSGVVEYFNHANQDHDFADMLAGGKQITINAWLIPVDSDAGNDIDNPSTEWHFEETSTDGFIYMQNFVLGEIVPQDIGHAINMFYRSRVTYLTKEIVFDKTDEEDTYVATFTLSDGEGILINGLNENIEYTVTETLETDQVNRGIAFKEVIQVRDVDNDGAILPDKQTYTNDLSRDSFSGSAVTEGVSKNDGYEFRNNTSDNPYSYDVTGATTSHFAEEVHYYNYVPKVEKVELEHSADGDYVEFGDTLTYIIDWENNEMKDGVYVDADVTVTDRLDPGVTHIESDFVKKVEDANGNITYEHIDMSERDWKVEYVEATHTVTWHMPNAKGGERGYVRVKVKVNENAEKAWDYSQADVGTEKDNKVINQARVTVNNHWIDTNTVETPTWAPEKNETKVNGKDVTTEENGNLVGPLVNPEDEVTYTISYKNVTDIPEEIVIVDQLDPGVEFISAAWKGNILTPGSTISNASVDIKYDAGNHKVIWTLHNVPSNEEGTVTLIVKVKEDAIKGWHYTNNGLNGDSVSDDDYKIFNRASVQIGDNNEQFTKIVENPLPSPFVDLPGVGGVGTEPFYLLGGMFILCAIAAYTIKKRRTAS